MKRSRTALALFLGVFGGLLSAVEWTGPVSVASEDTSRTPAARSRWSSMGGCEFLRSLDYCEFAYDRSPLRPKVIVPLRDTSIDELDTSCNALDGACNDFDIDQAICEGRDLAAAPRISTPVLAPAPKQALAPPKRTVVARRFDLWDSCDYTPPASPAKPVEPGIVLVPPRPVSLPPSATWMNGLRMTVGQVAAAEAPSHKTIDLSFAIDTGRPAAKPLVSLNVWRLATDAATTFVDNVAVGYTKSWDATSKRVSLLARNTAKAAQAMTAQRRNSRTTQRPAPKAAR